MTHFARTASAPIVTPSGNGDANVLLRAALRFTGFLLLGGLLAIGDGDAWQYLGDPELPGVEHPSHRTSRALRQQSRALGQRGADSRRVLSAYVNHLISSGSPYLRSHANLPVNFRPFSPELMDRARRSKRLVFLSIGYSTCHFCHLMAEEVFSDIEIAELLNRHFLPIKVDREERPDLDEYYLNVLRERGQRGGWPMNLILDSEGQVLFSSTFLPKQDGERGFSRGLLSVLREFSQKRGPDPRKTPAETGAIPAAQPTESAGPEDLIAATRAIRRSFDRLFGGYGKAPKFPRPPLLDFMLTMSTRVPEAEATALRSEIERTLSAMHRGGIWDQVGHGFHRYSTDAAYRIPHFEKMTYDNAQLASTYLEASCLFPERGFAEVSVQIWDYLLREMQLSGGGFATASHADSPPETGGKSIEGGYFTWPYQELEKLLSKDELGSAERLLGVSREGNWEGRNVLYLADFDPSSLGTSTPGVTSDKQSISALLARLRAARAKRPYPERDEKILVADNALVARGLAHASRRLHRLDYLRHAESTLALLRETGQRKKDGRWLRLAGDNSPEPTLAFLDDYAELVRTHIELFLATMAPHYLEAAESLQEEQNSLFWDGSRGAYRFAGTDQKSTIAARYPMLDEVRASGNSLSLENLHLLYLLTQKTHMKSRFERLLKSYPAQAFLESPAMMRTRDATLGMSVQLIVIYPQGFDAGAWHAALIRSFLPGSISLELEAVQVDHLSRYVPSLAGKSAMRGLPTAYFCEADGCRQPIQSLERFTEELQAFSAQRKFPPP